MNTYEHDHLVTAWYVVSSGTALYQALRYKGTAAYLGFAKFLKISPSSTDRTPYTVFV